MPISDYSVPPGSQPQATEPARGPGDWGKASWRAEDVDTLMARLDASGRATLSALSDSDILRAWTSAITTLLDPGSKTRQRLDPALEKTCQLSPGSLQAALEAVLGGMHGAPAERLFAWAHRLDRRRHGSVAAILAANVPALAVQVVLPALALRRPVFIKSSSREPLLAAALVRLLVDAEPRLAPALAAVAWKGGDAALEAPMLAGAESVVAFGDGGSIDSLGERLERFEASGDLEAQGSLEAHGPMHSVAVVSSDAEQAMAAAGLARDIALLEQRGCLSVRAIFTDGDANELADRLAAELQTIGRLWPPLPTPHEVLAAVQQTRQEAGLHGLHVANLPISAGTVVVDANNIALALPGPRAVRIHPVGTIDDAISRLQPLSGRLQGVALAGRRAEALATRLEALGVTRLAAVGKLQYADALWANGERHLIERLA